MPLKLHLQRRFRAAQVPTSLLFGLAPVITLIPAILSLAVIPFADTLYYAFAADLLFAEPRLGRGRCGTDDE